MNRINLGKVRYGEMFEAGSRTFIVLDHIADGVFCIDTKAWSRCVFDVEGRNNLDQASVLDDLGEYAKALEEDGLGNVLMPMFVNLKDTAGVRTYCMCQTEVGLLTLDEYGKYRNLLPLIDEEYWLATPYAAKLPDGPENVFTARVWAVSSTGNSFKDVSVTDEKLAVLPTVMMKPDTLVRVIPEQDDESTVTYYELWEGYLAYLDQWRRENTDIASYGKDPWCFQEWVDETYGSDIDSAIGNHDAEYSDEETFGMYCDYLDTFTNAMRQPANRRKEVSPQCFREWHRHYLENLSTAEDE